MKNTIGFQLFGVSLLFIAGNAFAESQGGRMCKEGTIHGCVVTVGTRLNFPTVCDPPLQGGYGIGITNTIRNIDDTCNEFESQTSETRYCHRNTAVYTPSMNGETWYSANYYKYFVLSKNCYGSGCFFVIDAAGYSQMSQYNYKVDIEISPETSDQLTSNDLYYKYLLDHLPARCLPDGYNSGPPSCEQVK